MRRSSIARLRLATDAASEPVTVADAKAYARVDDSADDTLIGTLITAARKRVEKETGLALMPQTWVAVFDRWPGADDRDGFYVGAFWHVLRDLLFLFFDKGSKALKQVIAVHRAGRCFGVVLHGEDRLVFKA